MLIGLLQTLREEQNQNRVAVNTAFNVYAGSQMLHLICRKLEQHCNYSSWKLLVTKKNTKLRTAKQFGFQAWLAMADNAAAEEVKPLKIGVRFKHPAIVLLYETGAKYRKRVMPIRGLKKSSSVSLIASDLKEHHQMYLRDVPDFKIEKMLRLIQNDMKGLELDESLKELEKEFTVDPDENLNDLDDVGLKRKKELMNVMFEKNRKKPGDPDYQYDVEVDFSAITGIESSIWDSEKEENDPEF